MLDMIVVLVYLINLHETMQKNILYGISYNYSQQLNSYFSL